MKFISHIIFIILVVPSICISMCQANELAKVPVLDEGETKKSNLLHIPPTKMLPINPELLFLITQLKQKSIEKNKIEIALAQLTLSTAPLNPAEQYLLLVAQALLKENANDKNSESRNSNNSSNIIALLEQAGKLSEQISEQQLAQPEFLQLHLLLADHYARQRKYDLAYLEKKSYLTTYNIYRKNKRIAMIASLEQSFEVKDKKANNALMESQNKLKIRRVAEVQDEKAAQQYNFTLIISTGIVFVLILFRQLRIRNKLILLTRTDALTGLSNRNTLFKHGEKMVSSFTEQPEELSILLLDLDHFKKINDSFGHDIGDEILMAVSDLVKETMRSRDLLARFGGDEFVALLPFADSNKAKAIAMRINEKISQYDFSSLVLQSRVTFSIGVATMADNKMSFDDLLHDADLAMYQAKDQGRNTVICYQNISVAG